MGKIKSRGQVKKLRATPEIESKSLLALIEHPVFCLHFLDNSYCLSKCDKEERASFANKIRILSKFKWTEIQTKRIEGYEKYENEKSLPELPLGIPPDLPRIGFYFHNKKKMVGVRDESLFRIIWFDRDFSLYEHGR